MTPSREAIEAAARALYIRAFGEGGLNNWEAYGNRRTMFRRDAEAALAASYALDFPQPSKSDEERAYLLAKPWSSSVAKEISLACEIRDLAASIRAEATLAERERCAKVAEYEAVIIKIDDAFNPARSEMLTACMIVAKAIRKGE